MIFAAPWLLFALPALPLLWWLLRVTPPAARAETFPAIRLLAGLHAREETPARTPWWLLLLRMLAAALIIVGLAGPVLDAGAMLPGQGPVLLVLDNGWSAAADWPARLRAANAVLDRAARAGRPVALLTTAPDGSAAAPHILPPMPAAELRPRLAALRPLPWPADHDAAATALAGWHHSGTAVAYVADDVASTADDRFANALRAAGPVTELRAGGTAPGAGPVRLLLPPAPDPGHLVARVATLTWPTVQPVFILAETGDGRVLARADATIPAGASAASLPIALPLELRNQLARLVLAGPPSAGSVVLLDERWRRRPVGLLTGDVAGGEMPLLGSMYYVQKALAPYAELRQGNLKTLLSRPLSVILLADQPLAPGPEQDALGAWVKKGGLLIRFAGPRLADATAGAAPGADQLLPVKLLAGDRELGGAMSWSKPARLAPFPPGSPFRGLTPPAEVTVTRQVLAEPSAVLAAHTWASLADGTPLVTEAADGNGRIVLFHTTANADWSNLALSGLFVDMLRRLVALSAGVTPTPESTVLAPVEILDGFGQTGTPPPAAQGLAANAFDHTPVSPHHPPGLYGPENGRRALNLSADLPALRQAAPIAGGRLETLDAVARERAIGPWLLAAALVLLAIDLLLALRLRGLLRLAGAAAVALLLALPPARAQGGSHAAPLPDDFPALETRLAYVVTGNPQTDHLSQLGLASLSDFVTQRTAAILGPPKGVRPGHDDLSFYPLLYWPITPDAQNPGPAAIAALNSFMGHGGIILIDTQGSDADASGSGAGMAPGAAAALKRMARGLIVPPLVPLSIDHVLARSFYLLRVFPGRYEGAPVWVQSGQDRNNDGVSPIVIGANDWAAAWAVDDDGRYPYATIPGGDRQRLLAYRFGVNLVMYALTGNYKGDQVHVPAILERLGQ